MMDPSKRFCSVHGEYQTTTFSQDRPRCPLGMVPVGSKPVGDVASDEADRLRAEIERVSGLWEASAQEAQRVAVRLTIERNEARDRLRDAQEEAVVLRAELKRSRKTAQESTVPESTLAVPCPHAEDDVVIVVGEGMSHWCQRCGALSIRGTDGWLTKLPIGQGGGTTFVHHDEEEQKHDAVEGRR